MHNHSLFDRPGLMAKGVAAETAFLSWQGVYFPAATVADVRKNADYQRREIDFILTSAAGQTRSYEVKSDDWIATSGNLTFELCRIHHTSDIAPVYLGWAVFSEADRLMAWCPPAATFYLADMGDFRRACQRYVSDYGKDASIRPVTTDHRRTTVNVFVPLGYVPHRRFVCRDGAWREAAS